MMTSREIACMMVVLLLSVVAGRAEECAAQRRATIWVDACSGEPVTYEAMLDDFKTARVVYLGERHSLARHHAIQAAVIRDLAARGSDLLLGIEQMEARYQESLDRYCRGELSFDALAETTQWETRWPGYEQYREVLENARGVGAPIVALNAPAETIREVARKGGLDQLDAETRSNLPPDVWLDDPAYEKWLNMQLMVHMMATPQRLRPMVEAQMCRDATMAATLCAALRSERGEGRTAVVVCGAGHVAYGLGTPDRVRRRLPEVTDRVVLLSESGDVTLSEREKSMSRPIRITHDQYREIGRPVADYLHITSLKAETCPDPTRDANPRAD